MSASPVYASIPAQPLPGLYRSLWQHAQGARDVLVCAFGLLIGSQLVKLSVPWFAAHAIDALQRGGTQGLREAASWIGLLLLAQVCVWILHGPGRILERNVGIRVRRGVAGALYDKLLSAPLAWHDRHHSAELQHRVSQSSSALYTFAQTQFIYLQSVVNFVGPIVALTLLSRTTGGWAMFGYALVALVVLRFDGALMKLARRENEAERRYVAGLLEFIGHAATVQSLRLQAASRRLLSKRLDGVFAPLARSIVLNEARWCTVDLMSAVLTWGLVTAYVLSELAHAAGGALLMGSVFMVYQYAQQAGGVVGSIASNFQNFARTRTDFASADPIRLAPVQPAGAVTVDESWRRIDIHDLCFEREHQSVADAERASGSLRHASLSLHRGERIALVGPSGSGKSTLLRVLAGLYEPSRVHIDVDGVARLGVRHLGSVGTLIPQEADVFEATARENLAFDASTDTAELARAVHVSVFDEVCARWPQGLETPISERGFNLSGGQRQRLALARGLHAARQSSLLLLDEPTSALDSVTESLVLRRLDAGFSDACIVASVHRLSLLDHFDRVVLMDAGRVVDTGTMEELRLRQPLFARMLRDVRQSDTDSPDPTPREPAVA